VKNSKYLAENLRQEIILLDNREYLTVFFPQRLYPDVCRPQPLPFDQKPENEMSEIRQIKRSFWEDTSQAEQTRQKKKKREERTL